MEINLNYFKIVNNDTYSDLASSNDLIDKAKMRLIDWLQPISGPVDAEQIEMINDEWMTWLDTSMGCPVPGMLYAQVEVSGHRIQFNYQGKTYTVHINLEGTSIVSPDFIPSGILPNSRNDALSIFDLCAKMAKTPSHSADGQQAREEEQDCLDVKNSI